MRHASANRAPSPGSGRSAARARAALRDRRYEWAYLFGAVCPERSTGAAIIMPEVNIAAMNEHLAEISRRVWVGAIALLVLDGAGWHTSPRLKRPDNIVLLPLPAYSPELNPVENVWQFLRANFLSHRVYDTYDAILDACQSAWNKLMQMPERIASITRRSWAKPVTYAARAPYNPSCDNCGRCTPQTSCTCAACMRGQSAAIVRSSTCTRHAGAAFRHQPLRMAAPIAAIACNVDHRQPCRNLVE